MAEPLDGSVVEIQVRDLDVGRQRARIDREAVILRGDFDLAGAELLHRMIRAAMAELQLERLAADSEAKNLVSEADAERRNVRLDHVANVVDGIRQRGGIARPVAEEDAVRLDRQQIAARGAAAGKTRTSHPYASRRRRMFHLMPKS